MKLKLLKDFVLANPNPAIKHWSFSKDEILDTDNEHLIDRLLVLKAADLLDKGQTKKQPVTQNKKLEVESNKSMHVEEVAPKKKVASKLKI